MADAPTAPSTRPHAIDPAARATHRRWLLEVTSLPTASGKESRAVAWIERWAAARPAVELTVDAAGNLHASIRREARDSLPPGSRPVYLTAHLDHPAFVVERIVAPGTLQLSFRGGVMDEYFSDARVVVWTGSDERIGATLTGTTHAEGPFKHYLARLDDAGAGRGGPAGSTSIAVGDVAVWDVGPAEEIDGLMHALACDDLAAAAAAVAAMDVLLGLHAKDPASIGDVRLLFTRAEEIGFIGAIAACRERTMPMDARVIALENSRSFAESPIGGGPIVRVGDRLSVFSPALTEAIARRAEEVAGGPASVTASQKLADAPAWKWQRKLMAGGACEASVFCASGYEATCVCLPLGNYHNMADLAAVQAGANTTRPRVAREFISVADYEGLVDLLVACGQRLPASAPLRERFERLWTERSFVLA